MYVQLTCNICYNNMYLIFDVMLQSEADGNMNCTRQLTTAFHILKRYCTNTKWYVLGIIFFGEYFRLSEIRA